MAHGCELGNGQRLILDQLEAKTLVTLFSSSAGQQQQATQGIQTGSWTAEPEVFRVVNGWVVKLHTAQGERFVQIQGNNIGVLGNAPALSDAQQMQIQQTSSLSAMPPISMQPMKPMQMGIPMGLQPMEMKMGNMSMQMGNPIVPSSSAKTRQFCSQCGVAVQPADRFCSSCGHQLGS